MSFVFASLFTFVYSLFTFNKHTQPHTSNAEAKYPVHFPLIQDAQTSILISRNDTQSTSVIPESVVKEFGYNESFFHSPAFPSDDLSYTGVGCKGIRL
jgi:hypothetical protein